MLQPERMAQHRLINSGPDAVVDHEGKLWEVGEERVADTLHPVVKDALSTGRLFDAGRPDQEVVAETPKSKSGDS